MLAIITRLVTRLSPCFVSLGHLKGGSGRHAHTLPMTPRAPVFTAFLTVDAFSIRPSAQGIGAGLMSRRLEGKRVTACTLACPRPILNAFFADQAVQRVTDASRPWEARV